MDLPSDQSIDIYQIHRTPFFRRLHRKDSDDFERLKKAYESVRNFDDKPLQAQVKKIRLGKLLRRIKETFTNANNKMEATKKIRPKTKQQIRREELAKARQVGTDYSRQNLNASFSVAPEKRNPLENWQREKSRLERRLEYGNLKSQVNRKRIGLTQSIQPQRAPAQPITPQATIDLSATATKQRLIMLKKNLTHKEFKKFLVHFLSSDKVNPEVMKAFEEILQTKNDLYWDLVEAINQRQQYIRRYGKFMRKLSNLALKGVPHGNAQVEQAAQLAQDKSKRAERKSRKSFESFIEEFQSKTNIRPSRPQSPEVYIRTYRYTDDDAFLPPPSESLLKINASTMESAPEQDGQREPKATSHVPKTGSDHLSAAFTKPQGFTMKADLPAKGRRNKKFDEIIRETVRQESTIMLTTLGKALKH